MNYGGHPVRSPRRSIWPDRPLTGMEVGMVLCIAVMVMMCCLITMILGVLNPAPVVPMPVTVPSVSSS